jgi:[ribosomal protein S5]-alanine N-acetyltransferase
MNLQVAPFVLETPRMYLLCCDIPIYEAILRGNHELARHLDIEVPADWTEFGDEPTIFGMERVRTQPEETSWWMYLPVHKDRNILMGAGGYKGPSDQHGVVEIGYEIASAFRRQGYATEFAKGLIDHAFDHEHITAVKAHTLAELNFSVRVLKNCGMHFVEELFDPDDGSIWQWRINRAST